MSLTDLEANFRAWAQALGREDNMLISRLGWLGVSQVCFLEQLSSSCQ